MVKNPPASVGDVGDLGSNPWVRKIPWRRKWQPTPVFLPGKSHQRRARRVIIHGVAESDMTKCLSTGNQQGFLPLHRFGWGGGK